MMNKLRLPLSESNHNSKTKDKEQRDRFRNEINQKKGRKTVQITNASNLDFQETIQNLKKVKN